MIKPEQGPRHAGMLANQVPKAAITALRGLTCCGCDKCLAKAIAAAINAWPGMTTRTGLHTDLILPLPETKKKTQPGAFDYWPAEEEGNWGDD